MKNKPIGANCVIQWKSDGGKETAYFSFSEYDEATNTDGHGVSDDLIFGYAQDVDDIRKGYVHDFDVVDFELIGVHHD